MKNRRHENMSANNNFINRFSLKYILKSKKKSETD